MAFRLSHILDGIVAYTAIAMAIKSDFQFEFKTFELSAAPLLHQ